MILQHYYIPWLLEQEVTRFMEYYNHGRFRESLSDVKSVEVHEGRSKQILDRRDKIKRGTHPLRRQLNL